jgi:hypothetical protein
MPDPVGDHSLDSFEDEQRQVLRLLRTLPTGQRAVTALYYDGLNCEEIAEVLGKKPVTVRSNLRYAGVVLAYRPSEGLNVSQILALARSPRLTRLASLRYLWP